MTDSANRSINNALWKIYNRPDSPTPWTDDGNLPWDDPDFSQRMLREHLDQSHGAASRITPEREAQVAWLWDKLNLQSNAHLLDVTCGPGFYAVDFAQRGCHVTGIDFGPASIAYAKELAVKQDVAGQCTFIQQDVRQMDIGHTNFDAATFIYGQLAVFKPEEAQALLARIAQALKPGGTLCVELLNQERVDKENSTWWFTDNKGLWGDTPFLHLGERFWHEASQTSIEQFHIVQLEADEINQITLCDQTYAVETMVTMMKEAGFSTVDIYGGWDGLSLYDAEEWVVYVARKA